MSGLAGRVDFALAFALVHEAPDKDILFSEIHRVLKPAAKLLFAEPRGHVSKQDFDKTVSLAQSMGFEVVVDLKIRRSHAILLRTLSDSE